MQPTYWHKQASDKPLFPDLLWSRPENTQQAGKLLIVGGNLHGFAAPAEAYGEALKAGVGAARVVLPDALQHMVGKTFEAGNFAPSTPSGSLSQKALTEVLTLSQWADAMLLAGDLGRNSETAILLEKLTEKYSGQLTITKDAADYFTVLPQTIINRHGTTFVISFAQLQKLATSARFTQPFTFGMDLFRLVETLHAFTVHFPIAIVTKHQDTILVAAGGETSTTRMVDNPEFWRVKTAAHASVWWLQNPSKPFAALTSAVLATAQTQSSKD